MKIIDKRNRKLIPESQLKPGDMFLGSVFDEDGQFITRKNVLQLCIDDGYVEDRDTTFPPFVRRSVVLSTGEVQILVPDNLVELVQPTITLE